MNLSHEQACAVTRSEHLAHAKAATAPDHLVPKLEYAKAWRPPPSAQPTPSYTARLNHACGNNAVFRRVMRPRHSHQLQKRPHEMARHIRALARFAIGRDRWLRISRSRQIFRARKSFTSRCRRLRKISEPVGFEKQNSWHLHAEVGSHVAWDDERDRPAWRREAQRFVNDDSNQQVLFGQHPVCGESELRRAAEVVCAPTPGLS